MLEMEPLLINEKRVNELITEREDPVLIYAESDFCKKLNADLVAQGIPVFYNNCDKHFTKLSYKQINNLNDLDSLNIESYPVLLVDDP